MKEKCGSFPTADIVGAVRKMLGTKKSSALKEILGPKNVRQKLFLCLIKILGLK